MVKYRGIEIFEEGDVIYLSNGISAFNYDSPERRAAHILLKEQDFRKAIYRVARMLEYAEATWVSGPYLADEIRKHAATLAAMAEFSIEYNQEGQSDARCGPMATPNLSPTQYNVEDIDNLGPFHRTLRAAINLCVTTFYFLKRW